MRRLACALAGALSLAAGLAGSPPTARADEPVTESYRAAPAGRYRSAHRPRTIVREVVVRKPVYVYRTRRVVREVVVERPVYLRPRPVYREVVFGDPYGPPPFAYGPPPFRLRPAFYGPGYGPGPFLPFRPRPIGWGWGPGPFF
ncbi:hypothetical protein [Methylobacterium organophilum]|uniref:Uncharacterized protein n=1 Tax=Methylobacterium organophilum TaxID=410 RepID=A0ABQ4T7P2_METOR|nr:hypothetical protein [Methylobacterium organophilum]GJE26286.1 hypothetical protein LKMONMHP_1137 [Methylobacterium organophilum]